MEEPNITTGKVENVVIERAYAFYATSTSSEVALMSAPSNYWLSVKCGCGNYLLIPAPAGWAVDGLAGLRFKCLQCGAELNTHWAGVEKI